MAVGNSTGGAPANPPRALSLFERSSYDQFWHECEFLPTGVGDRLREIEVASYGLEAVMRLLSDHAIAKSMADDEARVASEREEGLAFNDPGPLNAYAEDGFHNAARGLVARIIDEVTDLRTMLEMQAKREAAEESRDAPAGGATGAANA